MRRQWLHKSGIGLWWTTPHFWDKWKAILHWWALEQDRDVWSPEQVLRRRL
jgi:hypothetical protein